MTHEGRLLLEEWDNKPEGVNNLAMDKAYEGDETLVSSSEIWDGIQ